MGRRTGVDDGPRRRLEDGAERTRKGWGAYQFHNMEILQPLPPLMDIAAAVVVAPAAAPDVAVDMAMAIVEVAPIFILAKDLEMEVEI